VTERDVTQTIFGEPEPPIRTRAELRRRRRSPRRSNRRWLVLLIAVVLLGGAAYAAWSVLQPMVSGIFGQSSSDNDYPGPGEGSVQVVVESGQTGEDIATTLRDAGVVKTRTAYLDAAKGDPQAAAGIQPGAYQMLKGMRGQDAFEILANPANRVARSTTIREGLWASETFAALSKSTGVPVEEYQKAAEDAEAIGLPPQAKGNVEGWLFPSTYEFSKTDSAAEQLSEMVAQTVRVLEEVGIPEDEWQRTLTIASIVEGEVNGDADRAKVARVILNRLDDGPPNFGLLQMDSTVHFVAKERGRAGTTNEQRAADSPYNTYKVQGLPPGPIGNPGKASIEAAANPAEGGWHFFVTVDPSTGETKFANTQAEHDVNVREFQAWCSANPGKC
jgi:UPF0755 protein